MTWKDERSLWVADNNLSFFFSAKGIALALKIPSFFVITKIDICPEHIFNNTMKSLHAILKKPGVRKIPIMVSWWVG